MLDQSYTISSTEWLIKRQGNTDTYLVINSSTGEQHTAYSHRSANFLQRQFNDQHYWFNYERHGTTITWNTNSTLNYSSTIGAGINTANWRYYFGDSKDTYFQFYLKKAPNAFQRWAYYKILGIRWEKVN